ncbi:2-hydroxymuconate tautomerase [Solibacillus sp. FSL H8-0538]|uniref:2-hydroxymuconate tautomerase n=1 Tax=Solibacillus sp. FSL H8-0538 TaxID=2921400 RepID=UPI0030FAC037
MPIVTIKMIEGRTDEQKRALVEEVTAAVSKTVNAPVENVSIIIEEMAKAHYATAGVRYSDK